MRRINYRLYFATEHDDWEDMGPAPGKEGYRIWKSKSTGEERIQIEKPGTPSVVEKVDDKVNNKDAEAIVGQYAELAQLYEDEEVLQRVARELNELIFSHKRQIRLIENAGEKDNMKQKYENLRKKIDRREERVREINDRLAEVWKLQTDMFGQLGSEPSREFSDLTTNNPWDKIPEDKAIGILTGEVANRQQNSTGVNATFFDFDAAGNGSVFKPEKLENKYELEVRHYYGNSHGVNEVVSYELSRLTGVNIVPPTAMATKPVEPNKWRRAKGEGDFEDIGGGDYEGSSQLMVGGTMASLIEPSKLKKLYLTHAGIRKAIQKTVLFDFITGNIDRHENNILIDEENDTAHAIDNGISISEKMGIHAKRGRAFLKKLVGQHGGIDRNLIEMVMRNTEKNKNAINKALANPRYSKERQRKVQSAFWDSLFHVENGNLNKHLIEEGK